MVAGRKIVNGRQLIGLLGSFQENVTLASGSDYGQAVHSGEGLHAAYLPALGGVNEIDYKKYIVSVLI